ncbi:uncharacterized protein LOC144096822 [Amblyomma americanum]
MLLDILTVVPPIAAATRICAGAPNITACSICYYTSPSSHLGSQCGWEGSPWYVLYRSVEGSQFGKEARCINGLQVTPLVNDSARIRFRYTPNGEKYASFRLKSTVPGGVKNILELKLEDEGSRTVPFDVLYSECGTCQVIKHVTAKNTTICMQYIPAEAFDKDLKHCHFIYDLECGHLPKYYISDRSCLSRFG